MKAQVGAFNQEKALVGAFSVIVQLHQSIDLRHYLTLSSCPLMAIPAISRVLDFKKVKQKERDSAKQLYKSKEGKTQLKDIQRKAKTFTPGEPLPEATNKNTNAAGLSPDQVTHTQMIVMILIEQATKFGDFYKYFAFKLKSEAQAIKHRSRPS